MVLICSVMTGASAEESFLFLLCPVRLCRRCVHQRLHDWVGDLKNIIVPHAETEVVASRTCPLKS